MIRTSNVYSIHGGSGTVVQISDDDIYFIDTMNQITQIPREVFEGMLRSRAIIHSGGIFEKTPEEIEAYYITNIKDSHLYQILYRPEVDSQVLSMGSEIFYLKNNFIQDSPPGTYIFSDGEVGVEIILRRRSIQSYRMVDPPTGEVSDGLPYMFRDKDNTFIRMGAMQC